MSQELPVLEKKSEVAVEELLQKTFKTSTIDTFLSPKKDPIVYEKKETTDSPQAKTKM